MNFTKQNPGILCNVFNLYYHVSHYKWSSVQYLSNFKSEFDNLIIKNLTIVSVCLRVKKCY